MPHSAYFKGSGERVWRDLVKRYGRKKGASVFYALSHRPGMGPKKKG